MSTVIHRLFLRLVEDENGCWIWTGARNKAGYGAIGDGSKVRRTHRVAYEYLITEIPPGLQLDHLCRNRACANPWHLEPVTNYVNWMRGDQPVAKAIRENTCKDGHEFTPENTYYRKDGSRRCRKCTLSYNRQHRSAA